MVQHDRRAIGPVAEVVEPAGIAHDGVELVAMRHRIELNLKRLDAAEAGEDISKLPAGYGSAQAFLTDLCLIKSSLESHGDGLMARGGLLDLIRLAETFGFHLLSLDVRQESTRHTQAVARERCLRQGGSPSQI